MQKENKLEICESEISEIYLNNNYLNNNPSWHVEDSPWKARQIHTILSNNKIKPNTVCEIGCGAGEIIRQLSQKMPQTKFVGYELSPQAFKLCKTRESERIEYLCKNIIDEDILYDTLLCIDVFEHVEDYFWFIKKIKSKAIYKIFHIPLDISVLSILRNNMMTMRKHAGHLHYFTADTAIATLKDCGYEILDSFYTKVFDDFPDRTLQGKIAKLPRKLFFAISPDYMVKIMGGCSLIVLAK